MNELVHRGNELVHQGKDAVVVLDTLGVCPNGFAIQVSIRLNPHKAQETMQRFRGAARMPMVRTGCASPAEERVADARKAVP